MKKLLVFISVVFFTFSLTAQDKGKVRVGFDGGLGLPYLGIGAAGDLDLRYNIMENVNVGVRFGFGVNAKEFEIIDEVTNTASMTAGIFSSTLLTGDYYFNKPGSSFAPYVGGGFGRFKVTNIRVVGEQTSSSSVTIPGAKVFGGLLRTGFELGHFRLGLEYNIIPSTESYDIYGNRTGIQSKNGMLNLTLGFFLGGGSWKN